MQKAKFCPNPSLQIKKHAPPTYEKTPPKQKLFQSIQTDQSIPTTLFIQGLNGKPTKQPLLNTRKEAS